MIEKITENIRSVTNKKNNNLLLHTALFTSLLFLLSSSIYAQQTTLQDLWRWRLFTAESGLPSDRVFDVVETSGGIPWANTSMGIAWYDGYSWKPVGNEYGLSNHLVSAIIPDERDSVLVVDNDRLFYGGQGGFKETPIIIKGQKRKINSIAYFGSDKFLLIIDSFLYTLYNHKLTPYQIPVELGEQKYFTIWNTAGKGLWLNGSRGLFRWNGRVWEEKIPVTKTSFAVTRLCENANGLGFMFVSLPSSHAGLWRWTSYSTPTPELSLELENILGFDVNCDNQAIMVKESDEVKIFDNNQWQTIKQAPPQLKNVIFLKYRSNGDLWVGTEIGLFLHVVSSQRWAIWKFPIPDQRNNVNEIIKRNDGSVWCGTGNGLVIYYTDGSIKTIEKIDGKKLGVVTGIIEDKNNNVWISSGYYFDGTYRWDGSNWKYFGLSDGLDAGSIHKIFMDKRGRLWFLGLYRRDFDVRKVEREPGAYYYDNGKFTQFTITDGLPSARVYSFAEGDDGSLWFGTSAGIGGWKPISENSKNGKWSYWSTENGLKSNRIFTLAIDKNKQVWFGDQWSGLGSIENDSLKYFTTANGLVSDAVWNIKIGNDNKVWIATRGGLSIYDHGTFSEFNVNEGVENSRIWGLLPTDDKVYLGTSGGGVQILNLKELSGKYPVINLFRPLIQNSSLLIHWRTYSYWGDQIADDIENRFRVDDQPWSEWNRERHALIPDLLTGDHTFSVQTKNQIGEFSNKIKTISFTVPPPFYLLPLFYFPVGSLLLIIAFVGIAYIRRKRKDDIALRKSEEQYRKLFETANDAIMVFEPEHEIILAVNQKACELYGYTREELIGRSLRDISKNSDRGHQAVEQILRQKKTEALETVHFNKNRDELQIIANAVVIEYEGRNAILSINRDVTELKQAEAKQLLLAQTVASAKDAICITNLNNNILFVNEAFIGMYGYSEEELNGQNISLIASPYVTEEIQKEIFKSTVQEGDWNGEVINKRKDGTLFPVELWSSVVYDIENQPVALVGVAREISERKKFEHDREKMITELRDALSEVKALSGLLPICSSCKKIRDDQGYWTQVETYISKHSEAVFTHGLCPDCTKEYFPEVYQRLKEKKEPPTY
jgi:PAS domain S-box-containing protein